MVTAGSGSVLETTVDGSRSVSPEMIEAVAALCRHAEDLEGSAVAVLHLSGVPAAGWTGGLTVKLVNRWEQAVRRLERLPATTIATVRGDCGGPALDVLLATDHRVADPSARLVLPVEAGTVWPGMALYRLVRQAPAAAVRQAVMLGGAFGAAEARQLQIVHEISEDLPDAVRRAVERGTAVSGDDLAVRRQLVMEAPLVVFEDALGTHLAACERILRRNAVQVAP